MKRKQVVKLLSIGMAGILAISSCNVAGSMVHAEEAAQEVVVEVIGEDNVYSISDGSMSELDEALLDVATE